jgi:hypothetical protein
MENHLINCPTCAGNVTVSDDQAGMLLLCPHCGAEFEVAHRTNEHGEHLPLPVPEKLPFFKSGRKQILKEHIDHLAADGTLSEADKAHVSALANQLGLTEQEANSVQGALFMRHWEPIQKRMNSTGYVSDDDLAQLEELKKQYGINVTLYQCFLLAHRRWRMDQKGELPPLLRNCSAFLQANESAYWETSSTWHQIRAVRKGYVGGSVGIRIAKGVRLSVGRAVPITNHELTPLSGGKLVVTTKRLLFQGDHRATTILLSRITGTEVFQEGLMIHKDRGASDLFAMPALNSAFLDSLVRLLLES